MQSNADGHNMALGAWPSWLGAIDPGRDSHYTKLFSGLEECCSMASFFVGLDLDAENNSVRLLSMAVVDRAIQDAHDRDPIMRVDALTWLYHQAPIWLDDIGLTYDLQAWRAWVRAGCPRADRPSRVGRPRSAAAAPINGVQLGSLALFAEIREENLA